MAQIGARKILNLGCGNNPVIPKPGELVVNHDIRKHRSEVDVAWDLNDLPWPWEDSSFDLVVAAAVLEHLKLNLVESLDECWRILASGGQLSLKLPQWNAEASYGDPTHRWFFCRQSLDIFDPDTARGRQYGFYTGRKWRIIRPARLNDAGTSIHTLLEVRR